MPVVERHEDVPPLRSSRKKAHPSSTQDETVRRADASMCSALNGEPSEGLVFLSLSKRVVQTVPADPDLLPSDRPSILPAAVADFFPHTTSEQRQALLVPSLVASDTTGAAEYGQISQRRSIIPSSVAQFLRPVADATGGGEDDDDDDDRFGRGNISPLSSPMSSRGCLSILEPYEDPFEKIEEGGTGGSQYGYSQNGSVTEKERDVHPPLADPEVGFTWKERAEAAEAQLSKREEVLEEELTAREEANRMLRSQLAARDEEIKLLRAQLEALQAQLDAKTKAANTKSANATQECTHCKNADTAINSWLAAKRERGVLTERSAASARGNRNHPRKSL